MADRIELTGIRVHGKHGVLPHEGEYGQPFIVDITAWLDCSEAAANDDLTATINYAELAHLAVDVAGGQPRQLIETVAAEIAERAMASFAQLHAIEVTVHKPHAPVGVVLDDVAVVARRSRKTASFIHPVRGSREA
ncbi:dihydroneopterin aldolase [Corynebacterium aquatimens]|uniref:7,8-dihydroneopterin aldolase n=1 Tax=Corynebacterium aquatimens TaxID=1190508 RepID=A0A931DYA5_9CORY|nr:dihydroneopterin aldolase [Corynebacterium aquatimens]MBG6122345.1 dihydroneopterin aldolase [Corynebacterium aquatimens]WJY65112.1 putative dihydroneopterin aldolase [Corynebacterium aquatimens]